MKAHTLLIALLGFATLTNAQIDTQKLLNKQQTERQTLEKQQRAELGKITAQRDAKINGLDAEKRALVREGDKAIANLKAQGFKEGAAGANDQRIVNQKRANALAQTDLEAKHKKIRNEANATFKSQNKQLAERFGNQQRLLANSQTQKKALAQHQDNERKAQDTKTRAKLGNVVNKEARLKDGLNQDLKEKASVYGKNSPQKFQAERELRRDIKEPLKKLGGERAAILKQDKAEKEALKNRQNQAKKLTQRQVGERDALMKRQNDQRAELKQKLTQNNVPKEKANKILAKQQKVNQKPVQALNKKQAAEVKKFNKNTAKASQKSSSGIKSKVKKAIKKVTPSRSSSSSSSSSSKAVKKTTKKKKTAPKTRGRRN